MIEELPQSAKDIINHYFCLKVGKHEVISPYYRNVKHARAELRSLIGKGTPEEIQEEVLIYAKLRGFSFENKSSHQIREFMIKEGIGVDCSGYIVHIYDHWLKSEKRGGIYRHIKFPKANFYRFLVRMLRPIENIGANLITGDSNTIPVELNDAKPGDLFRMKGIQQGDHVAMITKTERDEKGKLLTIEYTHSSPHFAEDNGVRKGLIEITDLSKGLEKQKWLEKDKDDKTPTLEEYLKDLHDNGIRRPKFLNINK